jgi:hypothetical protein
VKSSRRKIAQEQLEYDCHLFFVSLTVTKSIVENNVMNKCGTFKQQVVHWYKTNLKFIFLTA